MIVIRHFEQAVPEGVELSERWIDLRFTWSGKSFTLSLADSDRYVYSTAKVNFLFTEGLGCTTSKLQFRG
jgi:hypothetical protein